MVTNSISNQPNQSNAVQPTGANVFNDESGGSSCMAVRRRLIYQPAGWQQPWSYRRSTEGPISVRTCRSRVRVILFEFAGGRIRRCTQTNLLPKQGCCCSLTSSSPAHPFAFALLCWPKYRVSHSANGPPRHTSIFLHS